MSQLFNASELGRELTKWSHMVPSGYREVKKHDIRNWRKYNRDFPDPKGTCTRYGGPTWDILEVLIWYFEWVPRSRPKSGGNDDGPVSGVSCHPVQGN